MKSKSLLTLLTVATLGISFSALADDSTAPTTGTNAVRPPQSTGDAAQSKSGAGPGSTGNSAPDASPAMQAPGTTSGAAPAPGTVPNPADPAAGKSGAGPGGTGAVPPSTAPDQSSH
jgi:hypothetical protein